MTFDYFFSIVISGLAADKYQSLIEKINNPKSSYKILKSSDYEVEVTYLFKHNGGGKGDKSFNLNEVGSREVIKFLEKNYNN